MGDLCYADLVQTCCLPSLVENDATVAVFASKNADQQLHYAGVQLCDNQFSIVTSGDQSSRITSPQEEVIVGKQVHLVLTYDSRGIVQLHREGHLVESLKAGGPNPAVVAHTILAAVLVGSGPNGLEITAKAGSRYQAGDAIHFEGAFHEARFYPVALDTREIRESFDKQKQQREQSRVVKWD
jgi:hypothetical protein